MRIAIMQPYLFPYIGYFQLIKSVDKFIIYDDVNFINKGWINRNYILVNGKKILFTVPLVQASQNKKINEIEIINNTKWKINFLKTIQNSYKKAFQFNIVYPLIEQIINYEEKKLSLFNFNSIKLISEFLEIKTEIIKSSNTYNNSHLKGQERILDICKQENTNMYINPVGGVELYTKEIFEQQKIELFFLNSLNIKYSQFKNDFVPYLSIIDLLMFNNKEMVFNILLEKYELI